MLDLLTRPQPAHTREVVTQELRVQLGDPEEADILLDRLWDAWELLDELKHRLGKRAARRLLCTPAPRLPDAVHWHSYDALLSRGGK